MSSMCTRGGGGTVRRIIGVDKTKVMGGCFEMLLPQITIVGCEVEVAGVTFTCHQKSRQLVIFYDHSRLELAPMTNLLKFQLSALVDGLPGSTPRMQSWQSK